MPDIPSLFNRVDFFGKLLPGYLALTLFIIIFKPELLFSKDQAISVDLFSAVVIIVGGPAIGLALQQFHRDVYSIRSLAARSRKAERKRQVREYAHIRINCTADERMEMERAEADYDFSVSTGLALFLLGLYGQVMGSPHVAIPPLLFVLSMVFFVGGINERKESYSPVYLELRKKYPLSP